MIKSITLEKAISQAFNIENVPQFRSSKPVKEARAWLESEGFEVEYYKGELKAGAVCVYTYGASNPMYTVVKAGDTLKGANVLAGLYATKKKSKSQERREAVQNEQNTEDETPEIESAPEPQSEPQTTVNEPKTKRKYRRKN